MGRRASADGLESTHSASDLGLDARKPRLGLNSGDFPLIPGDTDRCGVWGPLHPIPARCARGRQWPIRSVARPPLPAGPWVPYVARAPACPAFDAVPWSGRRLPPAEPCSARPTTGSSLSVKFHSCLRSYRSLATTGTSGSPSCKFCCRMPRCAVWSSPSCGSQPRAPIRPPARPWER